MLRKIIVLTMLLISVPGVFAQSTPSIRISEVKAKPIQAGPVKITFESFRPNALHMGMGYVRLKVENNSDGFATFSPSRLHFVAEDGEQSDLFTEKESGLALRDRDIAPGARIREDFIVHPTIDLPCRLYYNGKLLAVITR